MAAAEGLRHANEALTLMGTPLLWQPRTAACIVLHSQTPACRCPGQKLSQFGSVQAKTNMDESSYDRIRPCVHSGIRLAQVIRVKESVPDPRG